MSEKVKLIKKNSRQEIPSFLKKNLYAVIIFCFSFLLFANTLSHKYNLDDELVTKNHKLTSQGLKAIPEIFTSPYYSDNAGYAYEYRPLVHTSFALEHQLFGENPHISHFINNLLYAVLCVLLFTVLSLLFRGLNVFVPFLAAMLFVVHPVHTEVVASIKNRDEILALLFSLLAWYFILKHTEQRIWLSLILGFLMFSLALLSKISVFSFAIIIPFSILFIYRLPLYKTLAVAGALFLPAFFLIRLVDVEFKLQIFSAIAGVLYLSYILILFLKWKLPKSENLFGLFKGLLHFFKQEVFPFNHPLFVPLFYLLVISLCLSTLFTRIEIAGYNTVILTTFLCLLFSIRAEGFFKWLLLLTFSLSLWMMRNLVSEHFLFILFLSWCYFALLYIKNSSIREKLIYGSLLLATVVFSIFMDPTELDPYLVVLFISLIPYSHNLVRKTGNLGFYTLILLIAVWSIGTFQFFSFMDNSGPTYETSIAPVFMLYLLAVYYPQKLKIKTASSTAIFVASYCIFSFYIPQNNPFSLAKKNWPEVLSTQKLAPYDSLSLVSKSVPEKQGHIMNSPLPSSSKNLLPDIIPSTVDRPLDFVENPVSYKDSKAMKVASAFDVTLKYLKLLVVPYPLAFYYGYREITPVSFSDTTVIISIIIHSILLILMLYFLWKDERFAFFGILIYFGTISQFTNIYQAVPGMMAERYLLGPSIGFCMLLAYALIRFLKLETFSSFTHISTSSKYVLLTLLSVYSLLTIARNTDWKDDFTLFSTDIKHVPNSAQAHNLLALNLRAQAQASPDVNVQRQMLEESALHFKKALEIYPNFFNPAYDLGRLYLQLNLPDSAVIYYRYVLSLDSSYNEIRIALADFALSKGQYNEAVTYLEQAINMKPFDYSGYDKLSLAYYKLKAFDKSLQVNRLAAERMPNLLDPLVNMGRTYQGMGRKDSARYYFKKVLALDSNSVVVRGLIQQLDTK